jgi:hypothetical protein
MKIEKLTQKVIVSEPSEDEERKLWIAISQSIIDDESKNYIDIKNDTDLEIDLFLEVKNDCAFIKKIEVVDEANTYTFFNACMVYMIEFVPYFSNMTFELVEGDLIYIE